MSETLYKVLDVDGTAFHGGTGRWHRPSGKRPGKWMPAVPDPAACTRGYHLVTLAQLPEWLGPTIYLAEGRGQVDHQDDKSAWEQARLLRRLPWDETTARLFAADCAEHVLHFFEVEHPDDSRPRDAIAAARAYAHGEIDVVSRDAAGAAAWAAAGDAAGDAAWAAACEWQAQRLAHYLGTAP